jgi:hypothetical protein
MEPHEIRRLDRRRRPALGPELHGAPEYNLLCGLFRLCAEELICR